MREVRIAIAGFDDVGQEIADLLISRGDHYARVYGVKVQIVAVCGTAAGIADKGGLNAVQFGQLQIGNTGAGFVMSSKPDILIEAFASDCQTGESGLDYIRTALAAGCDTVSTSSASLIHGWQELRHLACATGAMLKISGAIGAALPTIDMLQYDLAGCSVLHIDAIFNSSTSHLLDAMMHCGLTLDEALEDSHKAGLKDQNILPVTNGEDAACKLSLLAGFALGEDLAIDDMVVHGLEAVTEADISGWRRQGVVPRLIGRLAYEEGWLNGRVGVQAYFKGDPMALVRGSCTALKVVTREMGETLVTNCGSASDAMASTALKDLEHILRTRSAA